jgi:hypothetical protein
MEAETKTLQEVLVGVHFDPLPIGFEGLADWRAMIRDEFPVLQELPQAPPISLVPGQIIQAFSNGVELPRLVARVREHTRFVMMQSDRLLVGWTRGTPIGEVAHYPGYGSLRQHAEGEFRRFFDWSERVVGVRPKRTFIEVAYQNVMPVTFGGQRYKLGDIFKWVVPSRQVNSFNVNWLEVIDGGLENGRVTGSINLMAFNEDGPALHGSFVGVAPVASTADDYDTLASLDVLHDRALDMYRGTITLPAEAQ